MTVLSFIIDGCQVDVDVAALTGIDWQDAKQATGLHQVDILGDALLGDFDAQAALVWLELRRVDDTVTYRQVLALFSYATVGGTVSNGDDDSGGDG